ncbi:MAG TPA: nucleoside deaminase [Tenericutes bacterium]|nr:nucleoside deaminase [Mycoplasmatota bacterium]
MNNYMKIALKEAKKSIKHGDVPVGVVIVENGKIISKAHNKKQKKLIATYHAEILAINKACKKKKSWYLDNCEMYVTLEPCMMCCGAIIQSRIKKVIYATDNPKFGHIEMINIENMNNTNNHKVEIKKDVLKEESSKILKKFFLDKRK